MATFIQILLATVIITLTFLACVAGIQVFHILHEVRQALKKVNAILSNTDTISAATAKPIAAVNDFFSEVKTLVKDTEDQIIESTPDRVITPPKSHSKPSHRFFHRSGLPIRST